MLELSDIDRLGETLVLRDIVCLGETLVLIDGMELMVDDGLMVIDGLMVGELGVGATNSNWKEK